MTCPKPGERTSPRRWATCLVPVLLTGVAACGAQDTISAGTVSGKAQGVGEDTKIGVGTCRKNVLASGRFDLASNFKNAAAIGGWAVGQSYAIQIGKGDLPFGGREAA